ncbi:MAG: LLM class flavin-dependent oxidoreductase [Candidatus Dormiibacterota bacterium]
MHGRSRQHALTTMAATAQSLRRLFAGAGGAFDATTVSAQGYRLALPSPSGPITIAAFGDRAIAIAAEHADRMVLDIVTPQQARNFRGKLDAAARRAGRPAPRLAAWLPAAVDPRPETYAQATHSLVGYLEVAGYAEMFAAAGLGRAVELARSGSASRDQLEAALPPDAASRAGLVGDAGTVRQRLADYAAGGLDEIVVVPATAGDPRRRAHADGVGARGAAGRLR